MLTDYYSVLSVERDADLETIKKVFRTEIARYHPENNTSPDAREKFDLLIEAFNVLSDPKKRKAYDEMLAKREASVPVVISEKEEETYEEWQKEAKKKSKKSWDADLTDLLLLDLFIDGSLFGMFDGFDDLIGDTLGDVFDLF